MLLLAPEIKDLVICDICGVPTGHYHVLDADEEKVCQKCYDNETFNCECGVSCSYANGRLYRGSYYCPDCESSLYDSGEIKTGEVT